MGKHELKYNVGLALARRARTCTLNANGSQCADSNTDLHFLIIVLIAHFLILGMS